MHSLVDVLALILGVTLSPLVGGLLVLANVVLRETAVRQTMRTYPVAAMRAMVANPRIRLDDPPPVASPPPDSPSEQPTTEDNLPAPSVHRGIHRRTSDSHKRMRRALAVDLMPRQYGPEPKPDNLDEWWP